MDVAVARPPEPPLESITPLGPGCDPDRLRRAAWAYVGLALVTCTAFIGAAIAGVATLLSGMPMPGNGGQSVLGLPVPVLCTGLVGAITGLGVFVTVGAAVSAFRQVRATQRIHARLVTTSAGDGPHGTRLFCSDTPSVFCAGVFHPRVYVSTAALRRLTDSELAAVVAHERQHILNHDPLRGALARAACHALVFVPAVRRLCDRAGAFAELAADSGAVRERESDRVSLAGAMLAFGGDGAGPGVGVAPERVDNLLGLPLNTRLPTAVVLAGVLPLVGIVIAQAHIGAMGSDVSGFAGVGCPVVVPAMAFAVFYVMAAWCGRER